MMNEQEIINYCRAAEILCLAAETARKCRTELKTEVYENKPRGCRDAEAEFSYVIEIQSPHKCKGDYAGSLYAAIGKKYDAVLRRDDGRIYARLLQGQTFKLQIAVLADGGKRRRVVT